MPKTAELRIIVDTREQRPYSFNNMRKKALIAGDYSIEGLEEKIAIERKSLEDWINTILRSKRRFSIELRKLQSFDFAAIVIEGSLSDILAGNYKSDVKPDALLGMTVGIMQEYQPVQIIFADDRPHAYAIVKKMLEIGADNYGCSRN